MTPFKSFKKTNQQPTAVTEPVRVVSFKEFLGGGSYLVGPDQNKVYKEDRGYGGVDSQPGMQRDHQFPVSLGGTSQKDNIKVKPLDIAKKKDKVLEHANKEYKAGRITLAQARNMVINWEDTDIPGQQAKSKSFGGPQNTFSNFLKELPGAALKTGKDILRAGPRAVGSLTAEVLKRDELTPQTKLEKFFFGDESVKSLTKRTSDTTKTLEGYGLGKASAPLAGVGVLASTLLDVYPPTSGKDKAAKQGVEEAVKVIAKSGFLSKLRQTLKPVKTLEPETQYIFSKWVRGKLVGRELANQEVKNVNIPAKQGLKTILAYEKGEESGFDEPIKQAFDTLFNEAREHGLNVGYRENYLPQVYKNKPAEIKTATSKFLKDQGVDTKLINSYINGIAELPTELSTRLKLNPSFTKDRVFPNYETAMKYGLTPRYSNPAQLLGHYRNELETTLANRQFIDDLTKTGKLQTIEGAPRDWQPVNLPFSDKGYYAEPKLARMLNGIFRDEDNLSFGESAVKLLADTSKKAQEITLSAGVPKTSVNFFAIGQLVKQLTAGDFKAIPAFIRANSDTWTARYFEKNHSYLTKMSNQGLDIGNRIGSYKTVYNDVKTTIGEKITKGFDKAFNEKTFASFMPQLYTQTFKDAYRKAINKGMVDSEAEKFAGDVTKTFFGLFENVGRSKTTEDVLSATFFAPKFREGIINTLLNTAKSVSTDITNPAFYKNRRLIAGMALTYAGYNALNYKLNGNYMWENEPGREFALRVPRANGDILYVEFMPSFLAFARNMVSGGIATAKGDFKTAGQKFGSVFSMPIKITSEVISNKDYFGREIYKETDTTPIKLKKIALYVGLTVNHPFVKELVKQTITQPDKTLYQSISEGMELPVKFGSLDKIAKQELYEAMDQQKVKRAREVERVQPVFDQVQQLLIQNKDDEAQALVDSLSDEDYEIYRSIKASTKRKETIEGQADMQETFKRVQELKSQGKTDEAQRIVDALTDEEYKYYDMLKKKSLTPK